MTALEHRTLQPARGRAPLAEALDREQALRGPGRRLAAQVLRARDVPLSLGPHPHGPCAQLHHGRRHRPLPPRAGLQRAASHGLGRLRHAGRECRHRARRPSQVLDLREHRHHARQLKSMGLALDWSREIATCDPAYYRHEQAMFIDFLQGGPGRAQGLDGELGPGRPHGAGQRAGDRRPRLALRRTGREARTGPVVPEDHRLFGRAAVGARRSRRAGRKKSG